MLENKRITLVANTSWYLANFRYDLACALQEGGAEVHCIAPGGKYLQRLQRQGFHTHALVMGDDSFSPLGNLRTLRHLVELYRAIRPDLSHHFTPRCVVLGSLAAGRTGVRNVINALTGLGHVFTSDSPKSRLARPVLRALLQRQLNGAGRAVIFQNADDLEELVDAGIVAHRRCHLIRGSGVDTEKFRPTRTQRGEGEIRVLFASRLIAEKGVNELVAAMEKVVREHPGAMLWLAGEPYAQNPTSLTVTELGLLDGFPWVKRLGHVDDMDRLLSEVDIVALPSYREGTPKILLEAAACGLPIVATDIAGCRGVVEEGKNGFLVPVRDTVILAECIGRLCGDARLRKALGRNGRQIVLEGFSSERVIRGTLGVYEGLLETA